MKYILGMDIGGTNTRMGIVDENYQLINSQIVSTKQLVATGNTLNALKQQIRKYLEGVNVKVEAIAVGFPAAINRDRTVVLTASNVPGMNNCPLVEQLEKEFGIRTFLERDATVLLKYDMKSLNLADEGITIGIYVGTGIGNAVIWDGKPLVGRHGTAGELGHIPTTSKLGVCSCGNIDCAEIYCAGGAFSKICKENYPNVPLDEVFEKYPDSEVLDDYIDRLARIICTEVNIFDPDNLVLGGGVLLNKSFPKQKLLDYIHLHSLKSYPAEDTNILYSLPSQNNGIVGAAIYGFDCLK